MRAAESHQDAFGSGPVSVKEINNTLQGPLLQVSARDIAMDDSGIIRRRRLQVRSLHELCYC